MYVAKLKVMTEKIFLSLSDNAKLKMISNQLFIYVSLEEYEKMWIWLCDNTSEPFHIAKERDKDQDTYYKCWIYFYEETDLVAFKLKWME